jgi:asparagine synthase (glutamine-hydrolysing)
MCGIAGIIDFRGRDIAEGLLWGLCQSLAHRGPDDAGIWRHRACGFSVGLAHSRLAVIDPSPEAHQPMTDPTGRRAITYNGELYNYRQLREKLRAAFRTASDSEVALYACLAWGPAAVERFDAMWALAFVDTVENTGYLSRDPFGIKPLYYVYHDDRLLFASELSALGCIPDLPTDIDPDALACYLNLGYVPHPRTIYRRVRKLPPGHQLRFDASGPQEPQRFHRLAAPPETPLPYPDAVGELRQRIESAVIGQRIADVPLGAFLSGGLDSSIVVACLSRGSDAPVKTFSIGYADHPRYDETDYARMVARHLDTEHHAFRLSFKDILETVEPMLDHLGEPFADSSLLPTALVSKCTRQHVTVALSGDGGDELFGGYWRYLGHHYLSRYRRLPAFLRKVFIEPVLGRLPAARSTRWLDRLRQARKLVRGDLPDPINRHLAWARYMDDSLAAELLG